MAFPPTITEYDSNVAVGGGDFDPGLLAFDGTYFWQAENNPTGAIVLRLLQYSSSGTFVTEYDLTVSDFTNSGPAPILYVGGFLWVGGAAQYGTTAAKIAKIQITAGVPSLVAEYPVVPVGGNSDANIPSFCTDGTSLFVIAPYLNVSSQECVAINSINPATGGQNWQTTHTHFLVSSSTITTDNTYLYYAVDHIVYQDKCSDGTNHATHNGTSGNEYITYVAYSSVNSVLWAWDNGGNQSVYQINVSTMAIAVTIAGSSFFPVTGTNTFTSLVTDNSGNVWIWFWNTHGAPLTATVWGVVYDPTGATQEWIHSFTPAVAGSPAALPLNGPGQNSILVGSDIWAPIVKSSDSTYALLKFSSAPPPLVPNCNNPPAGTIGIAYSHSFTATGGTPPYSWTLLSGAFPNGLSMDYLGNVTGTPIGPAGTSTFTLQVTDAAAATATITCSITVGKASQLWRCDFYSSTDGWVALPTDGIPIQYTIWRYWPIGDPTGDYQIGEVVHELQNPSDGVTADVFYNYATSPLNTIAIPAGAVAQRNRFWATVNSTNTAVQYSIGLRLTGYTGEAGLTKFYTFAWRDFPWTDGGYLGPKFFKWLDIQANTNGIAIPMLLQIDGANAYSFNVTGTFYNRASVITLPSNLTGIQYRIIPAQGTTSTVQFYGAQAQFEKLPMPLTHFDTLGQVYGSNGWKVLWQMWLDYQSTQQVTVSVYRDGNVLFYQATLPAHTQRDVARFYLPPVFTPNSTPEFNKSQSYRIVLDSSAPFQFYKDGSRVEIRNLSAEQRGSFNQSEIYDFMPVQGV